MRRQLASSISIVFTGCVMPALLSRMSTCPNASIGSLGGPPASVEIGHVAADADMIRPESAAASLAPCSSRSRMATFAPCLANRRAVVKPDPARARRARNDGSLAFQKHRFLQDEF